VLEEKRLKIVTGCFGSGKTEFALNYVLSLAENASATAIVEIGRAHV
jgi:tRNA uridine 5-carbamoylmethylation protein Kti12